MKKDQLHGWVYFIADKPTKKNVHKNVPLVGTASYRTFVGWLADMHIDIGRVRLFNQSDNPFPGTASRFLNENAAKGNIRVVALGKAAMNYLMKVGVDEFYALPHPSGLNRKLNDKKKLKETLDSCKTYIYNKE